MQNAPEKQVKIYQLISKGVSFAEAAKEVGISVPHSYRLFKSFNKRVEECKEIIKLYDENIV